MFYERKVIKYSAKAVFFCLLVIGVDWWVVQIVSIS